MSKEVIETIKVVHLKQMTTIDITSKLSYCSVVFSEETKMEGIQCNSSVFEKSLMEQCSIIRDAILKIEAITEVIETLGVTK